MTLYLLMRVFAVFIMLIFSVQTPCCCVFSVCPTQSVFFALAFFQKFEVFLQFCAPLSGCQVHICRHSVCFTLKPNLVLYCLPDSTVSSLSLLHFELLDIYLALTSLFCRVNIYPHSYLVVGLYLFFIFPSQTTFLFPKALPEYFFSSCVWVMNCLISLCPQSLYFAFTFEEYFC